MTSFPPPDESFGRLQRAGRSVGEMSDRMVRDRRRKAGSLELAAWTDLRGDCR
jgi:hypothetical protein